MKTYLRTAAAAFAIAGATTIWAGSREMDMNGDGYKEAQVLYVGDRIVKTRIDTRRDGYKDTEIFYKNGYRERAEVDSDRDGRVDRWVYYYFTGVPWKAAEDLNRDGKPDYWLYLKDGRIYKWEQDRNADGKPDVRTTYEADGTEKSNALVQQSYDNDFNGEFESISRLTAARKEAMLSRALAEMLVF